MKKILIVGAGIAGRNVFEEISRDRSLGMKVVGFIDDNPKLKNKKVGSKSVLGSSKNLKKIVDDKEIDEVIIAIPSAEGEQILKYVKICSKAKVDFRIVPRVKEIIEGKAQVKAIRSVDVEDLLGRPIVKADVSDLKKYLQGKVVLITGAAGSIGSELSRQVVAYRPGCVILFDWWENGMFEIVNELEEFTPQVKIIPVIGNIQDQNRVDAIFKKFRPNMVFHAAAYKHVPLMEENPEEAIKNNVFGTLNLAKVARRYDVDKFIIVSTDKAAKPVNIMGATKLITEGIAKWLNGKTKFISVRFGNVLGSYGSVVPVFKKQIRHGGPLTVTDKKTTRYFMTIPEAVQLILKAAYMGKGGELFVLNMGRPVKIVDLAENLIRLSGYIPGKDIKIKYTGLRKGEKLHEKLFTRKENLEKTKEERIFVTRSQGIDEEKIPKFVEKLKECVQTGDTKKIKAVIHKVIKSFPKQK